MFETLLDQFQSSSWSLWGPFLILILCGLGFPIPEDVVLIAAGALGVIDGRPWIVVSAFMYVGVLLGDSVTFMAGHYLGSRLLSEKKQARVQELFTRYGSLVLFGGRFLPGLRAPIFFTAGSTHLPYFRFFLLDGLAALLSVPIFVWLGRWLWLEFQEDLTELNRALSKTQSIAFYVAIGIALIAFGLLWLSIRRRKAAALPPLH